MLGFQRQRTPKSRSHPGFSRKIGSVDTMIYHFMHGNMPEGTSDQLERGIDALDLGAPVTGRDLQPHKRTKDAASHCIQLLLFSLHFAHNRT